MGLDPTRTAVGTWSGGRFMHFGEPLDDERLLALIRPGSGIDTVLTADTYGQGEADRLLGRAIAGRRRATRSASSARSATTSTKASARAPRASRASPTRAARRRRVRRLPADGGRARRWSASAPTRSTCCCCTTRTAPATRRRPSGTAWRRCGRGHHAAIGVAPGPANGFTLDVIDCLERFGDRIDWAMVILNPLEPWPGELVLPACAPRRQGHHPRRRLRRPLPRRRRSGWASATIARSGRGLDRGRRGEDRPHAPDRRAPRPHHAAARLRVEPRPRSGRDASSRR